MVGGFTRVDSLIRVLDLKINPINGWRGRGDARLMIIIMMIIYRRIVIPPAQEKLNYVVSEEKRMNRSSGMGERENSSKNLRT